MRFFSQLDGTPTSPDYLRVQVLYPALDRAGIKRKPWVSGFHLLRHTAGTLLHKQTGSLKLTQKQLGHAQMAITADLYVHPDEEEMRRAGEALGQMISWPPVAHLETLPQEQIH